MNFPSTLQSDIYFQKAAKMQLILLQELHVTAAAVGSIALFIVLSGFSGLREFSLQFTNVFDADSKNILLARQNILFPKDVGK